MKTELTKLERQVLTNLATSEFMNFDGEDMIGKPIWSFAATDERKDLAGALGALAKKGLVQCDNETCSFTRKGYEAYKATF